MADALPEPLEMEHIPIDLRQDMAGSHYNTEQSNLISPVDHNLHHLDYKYSSSVKSPNPSYQQQADQPVGSNNSVGDNNYAPHLSYSQSYHSNSPSPQSPSPRLHYTVTEEGSVHHSSKSNEDSNLDKDYEVAMNPQPVTENSNSSGDGSNIALIPDSKSTENEAMDVDPLPAYSSDPSSTTDALPETARSLTTSYSDSKSDLGVYNPYVQPRQSYDSPSTVLPSSNVKHATNPKAPADQYSLTAPAQGSQRHLVDRNARDEKSRLERLMSPDDEQDSLLDPSQGVTSLMDMMQLVQLTKTEKSTKTRMVILQKIIQTDDIALLQKFVHHEERIGIRTLGNWLYSYYDKKMMRITMNILKALDKLPTYASDLRHLKIQGVVRLIATMSTGSDDPPDVSTAVTNLDAKWERTHHYQPTKEEAINLEAALAETRANKEARGTVHTSEQDSKSSPMGSKNSDSGDGKADSLKRSHKSAEQVGSLPLRTTKPLINDVTLFIGSEAKCKTCQVHCH
ncbi:hypothetical protein BC943DRAFT_103082 [Umbelopsis sp. AD052]|nr:hypothetical protein BC943DRAFT_103082 [Umbelopsis sp. AD052]